jgi:hypothetical protein
VPELSRFLGIVIRMFVEVGEAPCDNHSSSRVIPHPLEAVLLRKLADSRYESKLDMNVGWKEGFLPAADLLRYLFIDTYIKELAEREDSRRERRARVSCSKPRTDSTRR